MTIGQIVGDEKLDLDTRPLIRANSVGGAVFQTTGEITERAAEP
ncbi:MAG: hypothetical protein ACLQU2_31120 [Candidatus Binataceae bacterium]